MHIHPKVVLIRIRLQENASLPFLVKMNSDHARNVNWDRFPFLPSEWTFHSLQLYFLFQSGIWSVQQFTFSIIITSYYNHRPSPRPEHQGLLKENGKKLKIFAKINYSKIIKKLKVWNLTYDIGSTLPGWQTHLRSDLQGKMLHDFDFPMYDFDEDNSLCLIIS